MKCPKCKFVNLHGAKECDSCGVVFADIRSDRPTVNLNCPFNDHGHICGQPGSLSESTIGGGPWYCSKHWGILKGWPVKSTDAIRLSYRDRWYLENGTPVDPPKLPPKIEIPARVREPGEDVEEMPDEELA